MKAQRTYFKEITTPIRSGNLYWFYDQILCTFRQARYLKITFSFIRDVLKLTLSCNRRNISFNIHVYVKWNVLSNLIYNSYLYLILKKTKKYINKKKRNLIKYKKLKSETKKLLPCILIWELFSCLKYSYNSRIFN